MALPVSASIIVDLDQFKLHIYAKNKLEVSVHFDSPSRRFYLSVLALVTNEMKKNAGLMSIPLEKHYKTLALLNETVGSHAGSSKKDKLLSRIYRKWKDALPDLEFAPLFKVIGKKKEYGDTVGRTYKFTDLEKDFWANLFEYKGSGKNVRLRFSIDKLGLDPSDISISYGEASDLNEGKSWDKFVETLRQNRDDDSNNASYKLKKSKTEIQLKNKPKRKFRKKIALAMAIVLIAGIAITIYWKSYTHPSSTIETASLNKMVFPLPENPSIAVLPFHNLSRDPDFEYVADSITDNIITALSQVPKMFVIARNSVLQYKEKPVKVLKVSEELGVRYVLEGSILGEKERLRINVQLIDAVRGNHLWAKGYNHELKDLFALQDEITMKVLTVLRVKLTKGESARIYTKGTKNLEAYLKAVKAQEHILRFTKDDNRLAQHLAREIISIDSNWPNGYILLGWTHFVDARSGFSSSSKESLFRAEKSARKALALDDTLSIPHLILGKTNYLRKNWEKAITEIELAVSIDPTNIDVIYHYARLLVYVGRPEESIQLYKRAMRLDPLYNALINWGLGTAYFDSGRYMDAHLEFKRYLEREREDGHSLENPHLMMAATCATLDRIEEAQNHAQVVLKMNPKFSLKDFIMRYPYKNQTEKDRWMNALQKAGLE